METLESVGKWYLSNNTAQIIFSSFSSNTTNTTEMMSFRHTLTFLKIISKLKNMNFKNLTKIQIYNARLYLVSQHHKRSLSLKRFILWQIFSIFSLHCSCHKIIFHFHKNVQFQMAGEQNILRSCRDQLWRKIRSIVWCVETNDHI